MKTLLKQIERLDFGITGTPLTPTDLKQTQKELKEFDLPQLPTDVVDFLHFYNGFMREGRCLFGIDTTKHFIHDIIGENLDAELSQHQDILLLGDSETVWVAWVKSQKTYFIIDKATQTMLHRLSNFADAVRYILQIND